MIRTSTRTHSCKLSVREDTALENTLSKCITLSVRLQQTLALDLHAASLSSVLVGAAKGLEDKNIGLTPLTLVARDIKAIAAGDHHSMVLKTYGSVWVTGSNLYGQLGDESNDNKNKLVPVADTRGTWDTTLGEYT